MEEANEEAEHKGWCDTELSTNEQTRKEKTTAVETLHSEIDELEASIAKLTEDITDLTQAVAELDAAEATAFVQVRQEPPETFDKPYKGMGGESGGVVGMLEVIESDFARLEADTKAAEASAQKEYDQFMTDSEVDKTK